MEKRYIKKSGIYLLNSIKELIKRSIPILVIGFLAIVFNAHGQCPTINSITSTPILCNGGFTGSATASATGGTGALTYNWSMGAIGPTAANLAAGNYGVTVSDATGCSAASLVTITQPSKLIATSVVANSSCGQANGSSSTTASGGISPYTYSWSNSTITSTNSNLSAGTYTLTVTDANTCTTTTVSIVTASAGPSVAVIYTCDTLTGGTATATTTGGTLPLSYSWSTTAATSQTISNLANGSYVVTVTDATSCKAVSLFTIDCAADLVWPGDANRDLIANNVDLLSIGIGYGSAGPPRVNATINWAGQPATNWTNALINGTNYTNIDCNGDGVIDAADTNAIVQNYGFTHAFKLAKPVYVAGLPDLTFGFPIDTVLSGSTLSVPINLGSATNVTKNVYGIAFSITYDPTIIDTASIGLSLNNSWFGILGTDLIYVVKNFGSMGRMDVGITRIDHQNISGSGQIGELGFTLKDDVALKFANPEFKTLTLEATQITLINKDDSIIQVNSLPDSVVVQNNFTTRVPVVAKNIPIRVYPNPVSSVLLLDLNKNNALEVKLVNMLGECIWERNNLTGKISIDTESLAAGTYYLTIITAEEKIVKQLNIIR